MVRHNVYVTVLYVEQSCTRIRSCGSGTPIRDVAGNDRLGWIGHSYKKRVSKQPPGECHSQRKQVLENGLDRLSETREKTSEQETFLKVVPRKRRASTGSR